MSKPNSYANRFSKVLEIGRSENETHDSAPPQPTGRKIGEAFSPAPKNGNGQQTNGNGNGSGHAKVEAQTSGSLKQPTGFSQLLETWSIGKPAQPVEEVQEILQPKNGNGNGNSNGTHAVVESKTDSVVSALIEEKPEFSVSTRKTPICTTFEIQPEKVEPHLVAITHPRSPHCEEYRNLRTHLLHTAQRRRQIGQELQAVVIASARPGEGKSTTALNLAWLLAQTDGVSCLLIDSDLRMPSLADYLGVDERPGLSDVFDGTVALEQAIVKLNPAGLHLLPGGAARDDVAEMISGNAFRRVLDKARTMFDYIIIDAPPLAIFTDAAVLINHADGAMLVVKSGKTRYGIINRLLETMPRDRMLGVVLNGSKDEMAESHYDYYYNYANKKKSQES